MIVTGLYPIIDVDACEERGLEPVEVAQRVLLARPRLLQVRAKRLASGPTVELLLRVRDLAQAVGAALVVNDRADLAAIVGAPAVHVGQDDLSIDEVRRFDPRSKVGVSTHSIVQLSEAIAQQPDYVAFGPVFATQSKANPDPELGLARLAEAHQLARQAGIPLVAIGGISTARLPEVARACDAVAVIGALFEQGPSLDAIERQMAELGRLAAA